MKDPLVSVVIPNYNYAKYITATVESVLAQTYPKIEVIVVDDESKDDSLEVLTSFGDRIKVITQKNGGVSRARNYGAETSKGEFLAFLDADDIWLPTKIERQMERLLKDGAVGLVHCSMTYIDSAGNVLGEITEGTEGYVGDKMLRFDGGGVIGAGSTSLIRKEVFDEVGGFDPRMSTAADWDISYRIAAKYKVAVVKEPLVLYRQHNTNMHGNIGAMEHDMTLGMKKAFEAGAASNGGVGYGNLYRTLAGSYFHAGQYPAFARTAALGLYHRPSNLGYFLGFPFRRFRRSSDNK